MDPRRLKGLEEVALRDPVAAYAIFMGIPEIPLSLNAKATFNSFDPTQPAIASGLDATIAQRFWVDNVSFSLDAPNLFAGNIFQPTYLKDLHANTGIGVQLEVFSGPKYVLMENFTPLENWVNWPLDNWAGGWPLLRQQNIQVLFALTTAAYANLTEPNAPPLTVTITFNGHAFLDTSLEDMSPDAATEELKLAGFQVPTRLACTWKPRAPFCFGMGATPPRFGG